MNFEVQNNMKLIDDQMIVEAYQNSLENQEEEIEPE